MGAKINELWLQTRIAVFFQNTILYLLKKLTRKPQVYKDVVHIDDCSTIRMSSFFGYSSMRDTIGILSFGSKHVAASFEYISCVLTLILEKYRSYVDVLHIEGLAALLSDISIFYVRAACKMRLSSYGSQHGSRAVSFHYPHDSCLLSRITWKLQIVYWYSSYRTTALLPVIFLVWFRVACEIRLESYCPRHASIVLWGNIVRVYCKPVHIPVLYIWLFLIFIFNFYYLFSGV